MERKARHCMEAGRTQLAGCCGGNGRECGMTMHHRMSNEKSQDSSRGLSNEREKALEKRVLSIGESQFH